MPSIDINIDIQHQAGMFHPRPSSPVKIQVALR
jgi:hypothetical protein